MEKNYNVRLYSKKCEQYLSPFGNKVLSVLTKHWDKARFQNNNNDYQHRQFPAPNKRVLTFNDESVVDSAYTPLLIPPSTFTSCEQIYLGEKAFTFNLTNNTEPVIPKSVELIKTIPQNNLKDDFLHTTVAADNNLIVYNVSNEDSNDNDAPFVGETRADNVNKNKDIDWDDMLDSELLVSMTANEEDNKDTNMNKIFDIKFLKDSVASSRTDSLNSGIRNNNCKGAKRNITKKAEPKAKRLRSDSNVEKTQQKQKDSAEHSNKQNNFRKQKYTKAVKNWLNNVELHHPVDEDIDNISSASNIEQTTKTDNGKPDVDNINVNAQINKSPLKHNGKLIIDKPLKNTKKVVQAQLTNKDGVMKFSKPKINGEEIMTCVDALEQKPKHMKETKEKRKQFAAPIKSQIPVKDVSYEIQTIDEGDTKTDGQYLREINDKEIFAVLIYSNGFCQLNSHHTDSACAPDGIIINNDDMFYCFKSTGERSKATLKHLFENNKVVCYAARSILTYLAEHLQMDVHSFNMYDAEIGAALLEPDSSPDNFTALQKLVSFSASYTIATECALQKAAWYMTLLRDCWAKLRDMLVEDSLWDVFVDIEMKLLPIIADMERQGICVDMAKLKAMEEILLSRMKSVEQQCYQAAGKVFQIRSAPQVRAILYDELRLDTRCNVTVRETVAKGAKSTSEAVLRSLVSEHPLPKLILEYRHVHKAHATFLAGIAQHVKDGIVRPTWVQTAAATGRIACNNPNLQAIPKAPFSLVMYPETGDDAECSELLFRSIYVAREGCSLLAADFQHVECRVFAHAANCSVLKSALTAPGDLFTQLAAQWMKKPEAEIVAEERERTKRLVYASLYGAGTRKLMEILHVDYQQALQVAASFNRTFPSLKWFGRAVVSRCSAARGRLSSLCGRVRRFPHIDSNDFALKSHAERQAVNFVVQGSAADVCKRAMIATCAELKCRPELCARLLLQIHDELVWEVRDTDLHLTAAIIKRAMEGCGAQCGLAAPLPVALSAGTHWGHMRPYTV